MKTEKLRISWRKDACLGLRKVEERDSERAALIAKPRGELLPFRMRNATDRGKMTMVMDFRQKMMEGGEQCDFAQWPFKNGSCNRGYIDALSWAEREPRGEFASVVRTVPNSQKDITVKRTSRSASGT